MAIELISPTNALIGFGRAFFMCYNLSVGHDIYGSYSPTALH